MIILYLSMIVFISSLSDPTRIFHFTVLTDYPAHIVEFFGLAVIVFRTFKSLKIGFLNRHPWFLTACFCILFGVSDEIHQSFVPGRSTSLIDLSCDAVGILLAWMIYKAWKKHIRPLFLVNLVNNFQ